MYSTLLAFHSFARWLVVVSLFVAIICAYRGWLSSRRYTRIDDSVRNWTATIALVQFALGLWLYFISPIVGYFLHNFKNAVHQSEMRFFGMEHSLMMTTAVAVIIIGSVRARRAGTDRQKFKTMAIWFTIGLLIVLSSIPWTFWPFVRRPLFRAF